MHQLNVKDKTEMYNHLSLEVLCLNFPSVNTGEKKKKLLAVCFLSSYLFYHFFLKSGEKCVLHQTL